MGMAVIHFEDIEENVAVNFRNLLKREGLVFDDLKFCWKFVSYLTPDVNKKATPHTRDSSKVAEEAAEWIEEKNPDRLVLITDLTPVPGGSMDTYGLEVLAKLADHMSTNQDGNLWVANVKDLVEDKRILVVFLTKLGPLGPIFKKHGEWNIKINVVGYAGRGRMPTVPDALKDVQNNGGACIYADRGRDKKWASALIAQWIFNPNLGNDADCE